MSGNRRVWLLTAAQALLEVQFWFPLWLIYLLDLGFTLTTAVVADAVFRLVSVVFEFPLGVLCDRIGRRRAYLLLCGLSVVTFIGISLISSTVWLFATWVLWGILWALNSGNVAPYLYDLCQYAEVSVDPARAFSITRAIGQGTAFVSLLAAGYLYDLDHRLPWLLTAALAAVSFVLALGLPSVPATHHDHRLSAALGRVRSELRSPAVRSVLWLTVTLVLVGWSAQILFQPLALDLHLSNALTGWMYAAFCLASVLGGAVSALVTRRRRPFAVGAALGVTLAALATMAAFERLGPFVLVPALGFAYALGITVLESASNEVVGRASRAAMFSVAMAVSGIGVAGARPLLATISQGRSPAYAAGLWALIGLFLCSLALPFLRRLAPGRQRQPALVPDRQNRSS